MRLITNFITATHHQLELTSSHKLHRQTVCIHSTLSLSHTGPCWRRRLTSTLSRATGRQVPGRCFPAMRALAFPAATSARAAAAYPGLWDRKPWRPGDTDRHRLANWQTVDVCHWTAAARTTSRRLFHSSHFRRYKLTIFSTYRSVYHSSVLRCIFKKYCFNELCLG